MNSNERKMNWRAIASCVTLILFSFIAGASVEEMSTMFIVLIAVVVIAFIGVGINEYMKSQSRKEMESSMTDFKITKSFKIGNDSAVYYDATQEKIRLASIGANSCSSKDIDNVIVKTVMVCPTAIIDNASKFFIIINEKDKSTTLANVDSGQFLISKIENFEPSVHVCGEVASFFAVDKINEKILAVQDVKHYRVASYEDIIKVELIENGKSVSSKSSMRTIGGAALGGFIAGGAGMVVGGLSGKTTTSKEINEIRVKILLRDIERPEISILINTGTINVEKENITYKRRIGEAQNIIDMVSVIIDQVDKKSNVKAIEQTKNVTQTNSVADELQKLADLKEQGVLSEEEFNNLKSKLLKL